MRESSSAATALADGIPEPPGLGARPGFVEVTEAVISLIRDDQLAELRAAEQVHEAFTVLTVSGAGPAEVLREVVRAAGLPVVLETPSRDVLAYNAAGVDPAKLLARWRERSIAVTPTQRTGYDPCSGWLVTVVGSCGYDWARLVLVCPEPPQHLHVVIAEGAASALVVHRLLACNRMGPLCSFYAVIANILYLASRSATPYRRATVPADSSDC
jgi:purine catabolism regulator